MNEVVTFIMGNKFLCVLSIVYAITIYWVVSLVVARSRVKRATRNANVRARQRQEFQRREAATRRNRKEYAPSKRQHSRTTVGWADKE